MDRLFCIILALLALAATPPVSGLAVGKRPGPYSFNVVTGPQAGKATCYICETAEKPGAILFIRELTPQVAELARRTDDALIKAAEDSGRAWLTVLGERTISPDDLATWAARTKLKQLPVGIFDNAAGPPSYLLHADAQVTVILFRDRKVVHHAAFRAGEFTDEAVAALGEVMTAHFGVAK